MTILHKEQQPLSMEGVYSDHHCCVDCGFNTHPGAPPRELAEFLMDRDGTVPMTFTTDTEVYHVRNKVWKAAGMEPWWLSLHQLPGKADRAPIAAKRLRAGASTQLSRVTVYRSAT
jgi:hypothetical protein